MWMNEMEINEAASLLRHKPVYGPAAIYLQDYMYLVNENSDGWPYWSAGSKAADSLSAIVQEGMHLLRPWGAYRDTKATATEADVKKAVARIKRFVSGNKYLKAANVKAPELNLAVEQVLFR